jgi:hypothetical protein
MADLQVPLEEFTKIMMSHNQPFWAFWPNSASLVKARWHREARIYWR